MRVFVAGSTGVVGRNLLPLLVESGHEVIALTRSFEKAERLESTGVNAVVADAFDKEGLTKAITKANPEVIVHELTALDQGVADFKKFDEAFTLTNRLRTDVTDTMLNAARLAGAHRIIVQSFCGWPFAREGGPVKSEEDRLDPHPTGSFRKTLAAIQYLEETMNKTIDREALVLRYGFFYGPGTAIARDGPIVELVKKRQFPIVGDGGGIWSFIHVQDVARATAAAVSNGPPGIYNIVDDEPAPVSVWLPFLAEAVEARSPRKVPVWLARFILGDGGVSMMTQIRGCSNAKAKRELNWQPIYPSWRRGFVEALG